MIIFSISSNLFEDKHDQRSRLSSVSVIPDHDLFSIRDPWSWWQSLIMLIFSKDNHDQWLLILEIISYPLRIIVILKINMIRDCDYLQYQWSLIMISSVSGIPDHGGNSWSCLSSVDWIIPSTQLILTGSVKVQY